MRQALGLLFPLVAIMPPGAWADVRPGRGPLMGYVHNGTCVASTDANPAHFGCTILVGDLSGKNRPAVYHYNSFKYLEYPYRWRIAYDHFWATSIQVENVQSFARIPLADFDLYTSTDPDVRRAGFEKRYPWDPSLFHQDLSIRPIHQLARDLRNKTDPLDDDRKITEAYWEFLPTAATKLTLFILNEKKIQLLEGEFTKSKEMHPDGGWWDYKWAKEPAEVIAADFHAPFVLYPVGKTYYFVTQFCECYGLKDVGKGKRATERVWAKDDQPIGRLITDTATGKTFAFTIPLERKDGSKAKPAYFELSPKPEVVEYDPAKVKKTDFEYPYKQIRACVDVLLADKKIDAANHKPAEKR